MKILLLSDPNSAHTLKWARSLSLNNIKVLIVGLRPLNSNIYQGMPNIQVKTLIHSGSNGRGTLAKLKYLGTLRALKRIIADFGPDIVHAHYATSYGLIGALSGFSPFVLSVWGTDVFDFPNQSPIHRMLLQHNLRRADKILSTSHVMACETSKYTRNPIEVTPFGIDLNVFRPEPVKSFFGERDIVIGTVKALEEKYGIEYLIRAFDAARRHCPHLPLKLLIVGGGALEKSLKKLVNDLGLSECTVFAGRVPHDEVPRYQNMLAVSVSVSVVSESFGVAVIEASACEKPVIVSNMGGLPEVVENGVTGIVVPARDVEATAAAIERLVCSEELRTAIGRAGRERVSRLYDWNDNVSQMIGIYKDILVDNPKDERCLASAPLEGA